MKKVFVILLLIGCGSKKTELIKERDEAKAQGLVYTKASTAQTNRDTRLSLSLSDRADSCFHRADSLQIEIDKLE